MKIGLTGGTGFLGRHFTQCARQAGHAVIAFSRKPAGDQRDLAKLDFTGLDAVVHLAGENVLGLWTREKKRRIHESRVALTQRMVAAMRTLAEPPRVLVSASGVSFYGDRGDEVLDESSTQGSGFLGEVVRDWEAAVAEAGPFARTVSVRFGMVLGPDGGAWPLLRRIFRLGLGGRLGSGRQWMAWIHVDDAVRQLLAAVEHGSLRGVVNGVAPEAVTNLEFTKCLAVELHRPAIFPVPAIVLKNLPGGFGQVFLDSTRVIPAAWQKEGFTYDFPTLQSAIRNLAKI